MTDYDEAVNEESEEEEADVYEPVIKKPQKREKSTESRVLKSKENTPAKISPSSKVVKQAKKPARSSPKKTKQKQKKLTKKQQLEAERLEREDEEMRSMADELEQIKKYKLVVEVGPHD